MFIDGPCLLSRWDSWNVWFSLALAWLDKSSQSSRVGWSDMCSLNECSGGQMYWLSETWSIMDHLEATPSQWPSGVDGWHGLMVSTTMLGSPMMTLWYSMMVETDSILYSYSSGRGPSLTIVIRGWDLGSSGLAPIPRGSLTPCAFNGVGVAALWLAEAVYVSFSLSPLPHIGD